MRCRDLLLSAIKGEGELPEGCDMENCQELATALEEAIFRFPYSFSRYGR
jgi:hypothetical protein